VSVPPRAVRMRHARRALETAPAGTLRAAGYEPKNNGPAPVVIVDGFQWVERGVCRCRNHTRSIGSCTAGNPSCPVVTGCARASTRSRFIRTTPSLRAGRGHLGPNVARGRRRRLPRGVGARRCRNRFLTNRSRRPADEPTVNSDTQPLRAARSATGLGLRQIYDQLAPGCGGPERGVGANWRPRTNCSRWRR